MANKKKKGVEPSKEQAKLAMESIKALQKANDEDAVKKKAKEEEQEKQRLLAEAEKIKIQLAQERVKKVLKENLKKKVIQEKEKNIKKILESGIKIKWKSFNNGHRLEGYVDDKLVFEIKRGLALFSLYVKDKKLISEKRLNSYQGCSMILQKLKSKSEKLI